MYVSDEQLGSEQHRGKYNAPKIKEVSTMFKSCDGIPPNNQDICINPKQLQLCRISTINPNCDPITFVSFFRCGEKGFSQYFTELQFYVHRLLVRRDIFNHIFHNQRRLRVESYVGLADHINALTSKSGMRAGANLILPSSFNGSPRAMQQNFQDVMSVVMDLGKPDLFLTYICNPKWKKIKDNLFPGQKPHDHPVFVARIFDIKKKHLYQDLKIKWYFRRLVADINVIEFQKRGLPHMHLLLILADKVRDSESINLVVSAELPAKTVDPKLHEIVQSTMTQRPCGVLSPNAACIVDGVCTKGYPKQFSETTAENIYGYPLYRRRDNAQHIVINGNVVYNRWIVPYNPYLTKKYNCHINVEICSSLSPSSIYSSTFTRVMTV
ncbi:helitron_like_N domain-containing protein [Trichonephila clavipes]|uniref:Helitron_like_N domain-containing protein n=1 Tax=Trichonephila clavipes TaxID=2585209 RepID=A0A8X6VIE0_TRICX|nr:helitron_like_N domain-containing protein [Trichonephila clavipes]